MTLLAHSKSLLNAALALIYPEVCCLCGEEHATPAEGFVGAHCRSRVRSIEPPFCQRCGRPFAGEITNEFECFNCRELELQFDWARSATIARESVLEAIHQYKYQRALWLEAFLADLLISKVRASPQADPWDVLIPVPLYPTKQREREFNQSERLAKRLGQALGIPVNTRLLKRVQPTVSQTRLDRRQRQENVRRAFRLYRQADVRNLRVLLVDDVFTTGATTSACARTLKAGGAAAVCVWTVARGS